MYVPSSELGLSQPLSRQRVFPSPQNRGEGHTRQGVRGWGSPNSEDWRKSLALCLLCDILHHSLIVSRVSSHLEGQNKGASI